MPERKGRKHKPARARRDDAAPRSAAQAETTRTTAQPARPQTPPPEASIPALRARYAGFIVAVLTLVIGALMLAQGVAGGHGAADAALRVGAGAVLIVIALVIGVLALAPARVAAWLRRG